MKETLVYEIDYIKIPDQDLPPGGYAIVCLDPNNLLRDDQKQDKTWLVLITDDDPEILLHPKGLFWEKDDAITFAKLLNGEIK